MSNNKEQLVLQESARKNRFGWFMGNGWLALVISIIWFAIMYKHVSAPYVEFVQKEWWHWDRMSWGSNLLFSAVFCIGFIHAFIVRTEQSKTERVLFFISMVMMLAITLMTYQWGVTNNAPFFSVHIK